MGAGTAAATALGVAEATGDDGVAATAARAVARVVACERRYRPVPSRSRCGGGAIGVRRRGGGGDGAGGGLDGTALTDAAAAGDRSDERA